MAALLGILSFGALLAFSKRSFPAAHAYLSAVSVWDGQVAPARCVPQVIEEFDEGTEKVPGTPYQKKVWIRNAGSTECYVRARLVFSDSRAEEASFLSCDGENYYPVRDYAEMPGPLGWTEEGPAGEDGFYYCTKVLSPGEDTPLLLAAVRTDLTDAYRGESYELIVLTEAVQARDAAGTLSEEYDYRRAFADAME